MCIRDRVEGVNRLRAYVGNISFKVPLDVVDFQGCVWRLRCCCCVWWVEARASLMEWGLPMG
eukprot:786194-Alexandrium_andersonii.AAC.1